MTQMPRKTEKPRMDIPSTILRSDARARRIWTKARDRAIQTYGEGAAHRRVAYAALKHEYVKTKDRWVPKGWKGPLDPQAAQGFGQKPLPTARGKIARTVPEAKKKAKQAASEYARDRRRRLRASHNG